MSATQSHDVPARPGAPPVTMRAGRRADHRLYAWAATAAFAIVFVGFARSYYLGFLFGAPALPWLLHVHGALMTSWFALFFAQTYSIATHRVHIHRRPGVLGAILAVLMVMVGVSVAVHFGARDMNKPPTMGHRRSSSWAFSSPRCWNSRFSCAPRYSCVARATITSV